MIIRPAAPADAPALAAIYAHHVEHGVATFEEVVPTAEAMATRMAEVAARGLPYLVAEQEGRVVGFAYASSFRPRAAWRYTVEDSVYLAHDARGRGIGKALLGEVVTACEALGLRQLMAVIGDSANAASIGVHRACGFRQVGVARDVGFKHGRFVDVVFMQRELNGGDDLPEGVGLALQGSRS